MSTTGRLAAMTLARFKLRDTRANPRDARDGSKRGRGRSSFVVLGLACVLLISGCLSQRRAVDIRVEGDVTLENLVVVGTPNTQALNDIAPLAGARKQLNDTTATVGGIQVEARWMGDWVTDVTLKNLRSAPIQVFLGQATLRTNYYAGEHAALRQPIEYTIDNKFVQQAVTESVQDQRVAQGIPVDPQVSLRFDFLDRAAAVDGQRAGNWGTVLHPTETRLSKSSLGNEMTLKIPVEIKGKHLTLQLRMRSVEEKVRTYWR
jgi:hypothetical protein